MCDNCVPRLLTRAILFAPVVNLIPSDLPAETSQLELSARIPAFHQRPFLPTQLRTRWGCTVQPPNSAW